MAAGLIAPLAVAVLIAVLAAAGLFGFRLGIVRTLALCSLTGLALHLASVI